MGDSVSKDVVIRFIFDTSKAQGNISNLSGSVKNLFSQIRGGKVGSFFDHAFTGLSGLGVDIAGVSQGVGGLASRLTGIIPIVGGVVSGFLALRGAFRSTMQAGMQAEDSIAKLEVLLGNNYAAAQEMYAKGFEFSVITPFEPQEVIDAVVTAQGYLGNMGNVFEKNLFGLKNDVITLIGDMASFSGQTMQEAATALMRGDLMLLDKYGKAGREAYTRAKQAGGLGTESFIKTFVAEMGKVTIWAGMAEKRATTISGLISTITGNLSSIWLYISGASENKGMITLWSNVRSILKDVSDGLDALIKSMRPMLLEFGASIGTVLSYLWQFLKGAGRLLWPPLQIAFKIIQVIFNLIKNICSLVTTVFGGLAELLSPVLTLVSKIVTFGTTTQDILVFIEDIIERINQTFAFLSTGFKSLIARIKEFFSSLFGGMVLAGKTVFDSLRPTMSGIVTTVEKALGGAFASQGDMKRVQQILFQKGGSKDFTAFQHYLEKLNSGTDTQKKFAYEKLKSQEYAEYTREYSLKDVIENIYTKNMSSSHAATHTYNDNKKIDIHVSSDNAKALENLTWHGAVKAGVGR